VDLGEEITKKIDKNELSTRVKGKGREREGNEACMDVSMQKKKSKGGKISSALNAGFIIINSWVG